MTDTPDPMVLWHQATLEHPVNAGRRADRYRELMREHGHLIDREVPRCQASDNFYGCTLDVNHEGDHEARSGCISAHRWSNEP